MPERPDLEYVVPILDAELSGKTIAGVDVAKPVVLRVCLREDFARAVVGGTIGGAARRAHFVVMPLARQRGKVHDTQLELVFSPMLAGRFDLRAEGAKPPRDLALSFALSDGRRLDYRDDVQMGKLYVVEAGAWRDVPGLATIGADVLAPTFSREAFRALASKRRDQVKVFLMDKSALDAMGNAYADEVLWEAALHPKTMVRSLTTAEIDRLHDAIVKVLGEARATIASRKPPLSEKLRDFLKVRNRHGEPCPRCGTTIRRAGVHGHDAFFCPKCQPDARQSAIVDFGKLPARAEPTPPPGRKRARK